MNPELGSRIIEIARGLIGSHYINGAYGAIPGGDYGCPTNVPRNIKLVADPNRINPVKNGNAKQNLAVFAAELETNRYCVCAGNFASFQGGREASPTDTDLVTYLESLKGKPPATWDNYFKHFTPRRAFGPGPGGDLNGKLVWGESCKGIRHFDCVGFISFCYWKATGIALQYEIAAWRGVPNPVSAVVYDLKAGNRPNELMNADIVVQADHHIGFVDAQGAVIESQDTHLGVKSNGRFSLQAPGKWTHLVRLPNPSAPPPQPLPSWLLGWWKVVWRGQIYYYYFERNSKVKWTPNPPSSTSQPLYAARDTGSVVLDGAALTIHWSATGTVEKLGMLPSTTGKTQMGGTWNGRERLDAEKM